MIILYYFSGTGNSYYIAKELSSKLPGSKIIPIASILNKNTDENKKNHKKLSTLTSDATTIGFIFPCHGLTIPFPVHCFLKRFSFNSSQYLFAIATRGGTIFRGFDTIDKILKYQEKKLNASFIIEMESNDPKMKFFKVPTKEEIKTKEINAIQKLNFIRDIVLGKKEYQDNINGATFTKSKLVNFVLERLTIFAVNHVSLLTKNYFYVNTKCTECGICKKVCPTNKIILTENKPEWQRNIECYLCYACVNFCPSEAIQIYSKFYMKSHTEENGRYPHPYASVEDMIFQKENKMKSINEYA